MNKNKRIYNKFEYYLEDMICSLCLYYGGKKFGCRLAHCCCEDEKCEAELNGRIGRKRGFTRWDI
ncbi:MAG: hypothetical protein FWD71_01490 [Oscillospiraceae bacterium]|nr:hypothetical protein [Oscillospiraceae bacterium]